MYNYLLIILDTKVYKYKVQYHITFLIHKNEIKNLLFSKNQFKSQPSNYHSRFDIADPTHPHYLSHSC